MQEVQALEATRTAPNSRGRVRSNPITVERIRVAAYVRVSTDDDDQLGSFESQKLYYEEKIGENPEWVNAGIFADEAITGTKTDKRTGFQEMINRCLNGEMLLTIMSSLAQQEVESLSKNVTMGLKMKMKRGELIGFNGCLGYDYHPEDKSLTVNEYEAETVRMIYDLYLQGYGTTTIAHRLTELGRKNKKGEVSWHTHGVMGIIKNEKYKGDVLLGKLLLPTLSVSVGLPIWASRTSFISETIMSLSFPERCGMRQSASV